MTKKDYILIAKTIKKHYEQNIDYYSDHEANLKISELVAELSLMLDKDNIRFDFNKFKQACGLEI